MATNTSEKSFSLAPAIFTPFAGLPASPESELSREQKLEKILDNLNRQHEKVRKNMLAIIETQADILVNQAEEELGSLGDEEDDSCASDDEETKAKKRMEEESVREMVRSIKVPMKEGAKSSDYEAVEGKNGKWKFSSPIDPSPAAIGKSTPAEDVEMSGTGNSMRKRTARMVKEELSVALKELVNDGVAEIEKYDAQAEETCKFYRNALERTRARFGDTPSKGPETGAVASKLDAVGGGGGGGILKNKSHDVRVDKEALRRMESEEGPKISRDPSWVDPRLRK